MTINGSSTSFEVQQRTRGFGLRDSLLVTLMVLLWLPSLSTLGQSDMNAYFFLAVILVVLLIGRVTRRPLTLASRYDARAFAAVVGAAVALSALAFMSALYADSPLRVFRVIAGQIFGIAILGTMLSFPPSTERFRRYVNIFIWGATLSSIFAAASYFVPAMNSIAFGDSDRTAAFFKNPNQFGMALSLAVPLVVSYCVIDRNKLFRVAQLGTIYLGLAFSGSKTNLATSGALAFAALFLALLKSGMLKRHPLAAMLLVGMAVGAGTLAFLTLGGLNPRAQSLLVATASGDAIESWQERQLLWRVSIEDGLNHSLTGVGVGELVRGTDLPHSHNVFLDYFRTLGIPGVAMLLVLIAGALAVSFACLVGKGLNGASREQSTLAAALGLSILGYIFTNQFSDSFGPSTLPLFWIVVGLAFYLRRNATSPATGSSLPSGVGT